MPSRLNSLSLFLFANVVQCRNEKLIDDLRRKNWTRNFCFQNYRFCHGPRFFKFLNNQKEICRGSTLLYGLYRYVPYVCQAVYSWVVLPCMCYVGLCRTKGYDFSAVLSDLFWTLNFLHATVLKCDVFALQCQSSLLIETIAMIEWSSGTATQPRYISRWRPARKSLVKKKMLGVNYIHRVIKFELLM